MAVMGLPLYPHASKETITRESCSLLMIDTALYTILTDAIMSVPRGTSPG
jgi:hypothetical protein